MIQIIKILVSTVFFLSPVLFVYLASKVIRLNYSTIQMLVHSPRWHVFVAVAVFCVGIAAGLFCYAFIYSFSEKSKIVGIPIPAAAWQLWETGWVDFVGIHTIPASLSNFTFGIIVAHTPGAVYSKLKTRKHKLRNAAAEQITAADAEFRR